MNDGNDWAARANCLGLDPDLFFPARGDHRSEVNARAVCAGCQVRPDCLRFALDNHEMVGIWGGMSARERRRVHVRSLA